MVSTVLDGGDLSLFQSTITYSSEGTVKGDEKFADSIPETGSRLDCLKKTLTTYDLLSV